MSDEPTERDVEAESALIRDLTHAVMRHYGYTTEQIEAVEPAPDHHALGCLLEGYGWICEDDNGKPIHPDHDELGRTASLMAEVVEPIIAERIAQARREGAAEAWHEGHIAGVEMQHLIETGEDSWPDHLAENPYGVPPSLLRGDA